MKYLKDHGRRLQQTSWTGMDRSTLLLQTTSAKYPFLMRVYSTSAETATRHLEELFALQGAPLKIFIDNRPPFSSEDFACFTSSWDMKYTTSSPQYARSNGFIESMVKRMKQMLQKTAESRTSIQRVLLNLQSSPLAPGLPSPAEILHGRNSTKPGAPPTQTKMEEIKEFLLDSQEQQKINHDRRTGAQDLTPLHVQ